MATKNLTEGLIAFSEAVPAIHENSSSFHGKFANLKAVLSVVNPALRTAGLAVMQMPTVLDGQPALRTRLSHVSGEVVEDVVPLILGKGSNPTHEHGKAITYMRRYSLLSILNLAVGIEEIDNDADADDVPAKPAPKPKAKAAAAVPTPSKDAPLDEATKQGLITAIRSLEPARRDRIVGDFAAKFNLSAPVASKIQTTEHQDYLEVLLTS